MIALLTAVATLVATPLKLELRLGDAWTYRLEHGFVAPDSTNVAEDEERFTFLHRMRVSGVKTDEMDWESRSRLVKHRFGGEDLPGVSGTPDLVQKWQVKPDGSRWTELDFNLSPSDFRLARLVWVGFPKDPAADQWKATWPVTGEHWAPTATASYRKIGKTERLGKPCILLDVKFQEGESGSMSASGRLEVDQGTGILMAASLKATGAPVQGGLETRNLDVRLEVTELKLVAR